MENKELIVAPETKDIAEQTLGLIERLALNPDVDVTKMQAILDMQLKIMDRKAYNDYTMAMTRLQEKLPRITKTGNIEFTGKTKSGDVYHQKTNYAKFEEIDKIIRPFLREEGFNVTYGCDATEKITIKCKITHKSGHSEESSMLLPADSSGTKNNIQGAGSSISYGKRYLLCAMLNIITVGEDDDGQGGAITSEQAAELDTLLRQSDLDHKRFLKTVKAEDIRDIRTRDYARAKNAIIANLYEKEQKGKKANA